jgi:glucose-1-phosphate thymidylyltransferase
MKEYCNSVTLAGGFGTRLKEVGVDTPKGLLRSGEGTIIGRMFDDLLNEPRIAERVIVTNNRFFSQYQEWLKKGGLEGSVTLLNNGVNNPEERLGAIGDLVFALDKMGWSDSDIVVSPSDTLYKFVLKSFLDFCDGKGGLMTVVREVDKDEIVGRLGCAKLQGDRIVSFEEKPQHPKSNFAAVPFYFYRSGTLAKVREYIDEGGSIDAPGSIITWLIKNDVPVFAYKTVERTLDVGTPEDIQQASNFSGVGE